MTDYNDYNNIDIWEEYYEYDMTYYDHSSQQEYRYMNEMGDKGW